MNLDYKIQPVDALTSKQKDEMFMLMDMHYANAIRSEFELDLAEKNLAIVLINLDDGNIIGFSTQKIFNFQWDEEQIRVVFSGDTIIKKEFWGSMILTLGFSKMMLNIMEENKTKKLYWMLITKGFRTYKFLPVFFNEFYPDIKTETPSKMQQLMNQLGKFKFGNQYFAENGIIKAKETGQYLKHDFQPEVNNNNAYARFFINKNPGYFKGDELLCLTQFSIENLNPFIKRVLKIQ